MVPNSSQKSIWGSSRNIVCLAQHRPKKFYRLLEKSWCRRKHPKWWTNSRVQGVANHKLIQILVERSGTPKTLFWACWAIRQGLNVVQCYHQAVWVHSQIENYRATYKGLQILWLAIATKASNSALIPAKRTPRAYSDKFILADSDFLMHFNYNFFCNLL